MNQNMIGHNNNQSFMPVAGDGQQVIGGQPIGNNAANAPGQMIKLNVDAPSFSKNMQQMQQHSEWDNSTGKPFDQKNAMASAPQPIMPTK